VSKIISRSTYDICGDCYSEAIPDQYFPAATRFGQCAVCYQDAFVVRTPKRRIERGSEVLFQYVTGDIDSGVVLSMDSPDDVTIIIGDRLIRTVCESIGVGCDDTIIGIFENGERV
jgi:hypothetical protein